MRWSRLLFVLILVLCAEGVGLVFDEFTQYLDIPKYPFPFRPDRKIGVVTYIYDIGEHVRYIIYFFIILLLIRGIDRRYTGIAVFFIILGVMDLVDYLLVYNGPWANFSSVEVVKEGLEFNWLKLIGISLAIIYSLKYENKGGD